MSSSHVMTWLGFYTLRQDEIGVKLTLGEFSGTVLPGMGFAIPFLHQILKTKRSLQTIDLPEQQIVLNGNISVTISGNLNFRVADPEKALLEVSNYRYTIQQLSLTTIADVLGTKTIEEVRNEKVKIAQEIENIVVKHAHDWGLKDVDIRLTDAQLDASLQRAMMRETEAQKEANAIIIRAESDKYVAQIFADAAKMLAASPGAITLRVLQTLSDISNDKTTIVVPIPIDLLTNRVLSQIDSNSSHDDTSHDDLPASDTPNQSTSVEYPQAELKIRQGKAIAICPGCNARYNATDIVGNAEYDLDPDAPGQQMQCKKCSNKFTIPAEPS